MSCLRILLCIFIPPLAVLGLGWGNFLIVLFLWFFGWLPGTIAAFIILANAPERPSDD
jgi:uncharacterized membrane protein YqaE (UPF0057 family)